MFTYLLLRVFHIRIKLFIFILNFITILFQIKTAYRKKALSCHPDKNPDNPKAAELFNQLTRVLEILTDESARVSFTTTFLLFFLNTYISQIF